MNSIIIAKNLYKVYNYKPKALTVLKDIELEIEKGKITCILGPSGAGKSTLLHILAGLDFPTQGQVFLDNLDLYQISDNQRAQIRNQKIGFVFQFYHLLSELSALENVLLPQMISGVADRKKGQSILEQLGLQQRFTHRPDQLSGGEQQRVAIARSLINNPEIIFCDEPTGNLDSKTGEEVFDIFWQLNKDEQKTFVIVTHDETVAAKADRIVHIKDGVIVK